MLVAMLRGNPQAFIDGNINRLKTGQVLRLPDSVESTALPQSKAIAEVAAQNEAWRQGRRYVAKPGTGQQQLDATNRGRGNTAGAQNAQDNLSLVSAESTKARGKGPAGDAKALMVPEQALMQDGDIRFVYIVVDGKAKKTTVKTGTRTPGLVQVVEGLKAGDVVITAGQAKPMMRDGVPVMSLPPQGAGGDTPAAGAPKPPAAAREPAKAGTDKPANGG